MQSDRGREDHCLDNIDISTELPRARAQAQNRSDGAANISQREGEEGLAHTGTDWDRLGIRFAARCCWAANVQI